MIGYDIQALYDSCVQGLELPQGIEAHHLDPLTGVLLLVFACTRKSVRQVRDSAFIDYPGIRLVRVDIDAHGNCIQMEIHP